MIHKASKLALAAAAALWLPAAAQAGATTANAQASFNVDRQCSVSGATLDLGSYRTFNNWQDVANVLGYFSSVYIAGSKGSQYLNYGSINCTSGTPWAVRIIGTNGGLSSNGVTYYMTTPSGTKFIRMSMWVKKVGNIVYPDVLPSHNGLGDSPQTANRIVGTGTGVNQNIIGSVALGFGGTGSVLATDSLTQGRYVDNLEYTLTF